MKRAGKLFYQIAEPDNLRLAYYKAQKGKFAKQEVQIFAKNMDKNLLMLRDELLNEKVRLGDYHYFKIFDPKERLICASTFRERVLQHAVMNVCHPVFESFQISDSYACRLNKGTFAAKEKAEYFQKQHYTLKPTCVTWTTWFCGAIRVMSFWKQVHDLQILFIKIYSCSLKPLLLIK